MVLTMVIGGGNLIHNIDVGDLVEVKYRVDSKSHTYRYAYVTEIDVQVGLQKISNSYATDGFVAKYLDVDDICYLLYNQNGSWWQKI
jgi:hypothetical protein